MCGIVGYVGSNEATDFLLEGLRRLEYRGYDSSGVVTTQGGKLSVRKSAGRVEKLSQLLKINPTTGGAGIGHTRWATHGPATNENAHPHLGGEQSVALVHNGVIENHRGLKDKLLDRGYKFCSDTDSEVVAHLLDYELKNLPDDVNDSMDPYAPLITAAQKTLAQLQGTYGLAIMFRDWL
jgi:glucosamine--fructose-6-phosphate aminotransferase (isomerizing)